MRGLIDRFKRAFAPADEGLAVVRELTLLRTQIQDLAVATRRLESAATAGALTAIQAGDPRYGDPRRLLRWGAQFCSQTYEDGMIAEVLRRVGCTSRTFVEIGIGDGTENSLLRKICG